MTHVADMPPAQRLEQLLQARLALLERQPAQIAACARTADRRRTTPDPRTAAPTAPPAAPRNWARAALIERDHLAVDQAVGQRGRFFRRWPRTVGPIERVARLEGGLAAGDPQLQPIAVEFDFMAPARFLRGFPTRRHSSRLDEIGDAPHVGGLIARRGAGGAGAGIAATRRCRRRSACAGACCSTPHPARALPLPPASMNGVGARPLPAAISPIERPEATERSCAEQRSAASVARAGVAMLDQQPVGALAAVAVAAACAPGPSCRAAARPSSENFKSPARSASCGDFRALGSPIAPVPELHGAAAVLARRDGAFEVAVVERVILDLDGRRLSAGSSEGPRVTAQDLNTPSSSRRRSKCSRRAACFCTTNRRRSAGDGALAARLGGLGKIALLAIASQCLFRHESSPKSRLHFANGISEFTPSFIANCTCSTRIHIRQQVTRPGDRR